MSTTIAAVRVRTTTHAEQRWELRPSNWQLPCGCIGADFWSSDEQRQSRCTSCWRGWWHMGVKGGSCVMLDGKPQGVMIEVKHQGVVIDLTFVKPGDQFATRAGWTATIVRVNGFRVEGFIDTDYRRHDAVWRQDGTAQMLCDDLVEQLPSLPPKPPTLFQRIFGFEERDQ
jgi:hypothetical protein